MTELAQHSHYPVVALGRVAEVTPSGIDKLTRDEHTPVRLCNYTDVYNNDQIGASQTFMEATATAAEIERLSLKVGDIAVTKDSESPDDIGVPASVAEDVPGLVLGYHLALIRAKENSVHPRFLYWALKTLATQRYWEITARGVTRYGLRSEDMKRLPIPLPQLETQQQIADYLDLEIERLDELEGEHRRMLSLLDERDGAVVNAAIYGDGELPLHPLMTLVEQRRPIMYGIVLPGPDVEGGVPLIKGGDVHQHRLQVELLNRVDAAIEAAHTRSRVRGGDLVYAIRGSFGDVDVVPDELEGANITQDVARVSPAEWVDATWLLHALRAPQTLGQARRASVGATISGVNIRDLKRFKIPVPPPAEQRRIAERLDGQLGQTDLLRSEITRELELLSERREALITAAVTGQLDVTTAGKAA